MIASELTSGPESKFSPDYTLGTLPRVQWIEIVLHRVILGCS